MKIMEKIYPLSMIYITVKHRRVRMISNQVSGKVIHFLLAYRGCSFNTDESEQTNGTNFN